MYLKNTKKIFALNRTHTSIFEFTSHLKLCYSHSSSYNNIQNCNIRAFSTGAVCKKAENILGEKSLTTHTLICFPTHMGNVDGGIINLNELAHSRARGLGP